MGTPDVHAALRRETQLALDGARVSLRAMQRDLSALGAAADLVRHAGHAAPAPDLTDLVAAVNKQCSRLENNLRALDAHRPDRNGGVKPSGLSDFEPARNGGSQRQTERCDAAVSNGEAPMPDVGVWLLKLMMANGYTDGRPLGDGRYGAIAGMAFSYDIITGAIGDSVFVADRWCYATYDAAREALEAWDGQGEPQGWFRHPTTGRRVSRSPDEHDDDGRRVGEVGVLYYRW